LRILTIPFSAGNVPLGSLPQERPKSKKTLETPKEELTTGFTFAITKNDLKIFPIPSIKSI